MVDLETCCQSNCFNRSVGRSVVFVSGRIKMDPLAKSVINETNIVFSISDLPPWTLQWTRSLRIKERVEKIFGKAPLIDVPLEEIERQGLKSMLKSSVPMCYFLHYLMEIFSIETLFFILEVQRFQLTRYDGDRNSIIEAATQIEQAFIRNECIFEVNLKDDTKNLVIQKLNTGTKRCFDDAVEEILHLLEESYGGFERSPIYKEMQENLSSKKVPYKEEDVTRAIELLVKFMNRDTTKSTTNATNESEKREILIRKMIHAFSSSRLGIDFMDQEQHDEEEDLKRQSILSTTSGGGIKKHTRRQRKKAATGGPLSFEEEEDDHLGRLINQMSKKKK